jgi:hypothetical protein
MERDKAVVIQDHRAEEHSGCVKKGGTMLGTPWRRYGGCLVLALALAIVGCGGGDDNLNLTGTWAGTVQDNIAGRGTILFTFSQTDSQVAGTWNIAFGPTNTIGGNLSGSVSDHAITLSLSAQQLQGCSFAVGANGDGDNHFTGTYIPSNCTGIGGGTLDVNRQ